MSPGANYRTVLVCGGRKYADFERLHYVLSTIQAVHGFNVLVHGAAPGADQLAGRWAGGRVVEVRAYPADWKKHGRAAGPIRNFAMREAEKPDVVIAFPGGAGTASMVRMARAKGIEVLEVKP